MVNKRLNLSQLKVRVYLEDKQHKLNQLKVRDYLEDKQHKLNQLKERDYLEVKLGRLRCLVGRQLQLNRLKEVAYLEHKQLQPSLQAVYLVKILLKEVFSVDKLQPCKLKEGCSMDSLLNKILGVLGVYFKIKVQLVSLTKGKDKTNPSKLICRLVSQIRTRELDF